MNTSKRIILILGLLIPLFQTQFNLTTLFGQSTRPEADIRSYVFRSTDAHYLEIYIGILNSSLGQKVLDSNQIKKSVRIVLILSQDDSIRYVNKYELSAPLNSKNDFYDIQRITVHPGTYLLSVEIEDLFGKKPKLERELVLTIPDWEEQLAISSIQLISEVKKAVEESRYTKSGLIIEPLKYHYLNNNYNQLQFYLETYNTEMYIPTDYILRYSLIKSGFQTDTVFTKYKRRKRAQIDPIIISELFSRDWPSGDYQLLVEMMDFK